MPARGWLWDVIVLALVLVVYAPSLRGEWTWDDWTMVRDNAHLRDLRGLREIWLNPRQQIEYYPITYTAFWIEYQIFGARPAAFHLTNILLHGACAIVLRRLLVRLAVPGAALGAVVFAVHPVFVESVAWIAELKNILSGVFYLLSVLSFIRMIEADRAGGAQRHAWLIASGGFALLAMLSKASTVILPGTLLLLCWWIDGRISLRRFLAIVPVVILALACAGMTIWMENVRVKLVDPVDWTIAQRIALAGQVPWFYLSKLLVPSHLLVIYPQWRLDATSVVSYVPWVATIGLLALLWTMRRAWGRPPLIGWAHYLIALLPVLGFINIDYMRFSPVADHFQYLAGMGMIAMLAGLATAVLRNLQTTNARRLMRLTAVALAMALSILSFRRAALFGDPPRLWTDVLARNPDSWMASLNLAEHRKLQKQHSEAIAILQAALQRHPDNAEVHEQLGHLFFEIGQPQTAREHFARGTKSRLFAAMQFSNEAIEFQRRGDFVAAERLLRRAAEVSNGHPDILANLISLLSSCPDPRVFNPSEAVRLGESLCAAPNQRTAEHILLLAGAYASAGDKAQALLLLDEASKLARGRDDPQLSTVIDELLRQLRSAPDQNQR